MSKERKRHTVQQVYFIGLLLAAGLFAMHTWIMFEMGWVLVHHAGNITRGEEAHIAGPLIILTAFFILFITHLAEAGAWALLFWRMKEFPTFSESLYFTGTSITALGYGDIVLRPPWRVLGPIMAINGLLMFGCSTAFLFLIIQRIWATL
ncbi:ion channel [Terrimicrobium sacchariphilum]|uniref:Ion channel n=1 Tax=Terrimicrobium sacchariphilum TaxID=690879 RepID=A0A146G8R5_TERSA|nr:potassium channel family protein [Terrimicrobium sacchariphilum]GAT33861.1 ion channel [Terrimicrobium sacchariphilum]